MNFDYTESVGKRELFREFRSVFGKHSYGPMKYHKDQIGKRYFIGKDQNNSGLFELGNEELTDEQVDMVENSVQPENGILVQDLLSGGLRVDDFDDNVVEQLIGEETKYPMQTSNSQSRVMQFANVNDSFKGNDPRKRNTAKGARIVNPKRISTAAIRDFRADTFVNGSKQSIIQSMNT